MKDIILNNKTIRAKKTQFFGRDEEVAQLLLALAHNRGSTTLISGDRGSGKTSLINHSVEMLGRQLRDNLFTKLYLPKWSWIPNRFKGKKIISIPKRVRFTSVVVRVPLIPANTGSEMLKGIVLRAIIHTLAVDRPLSGHLFYPISYKYRLWKLKKMVNYKQRSVERGLSLSGGNGPAKGTLNQVYKSELDLSDIRIELVLASFFRKFASSVRFVIIFDETDKYEDGDEEPKNVTPEKLIYHTKNLFTTNGAHFIFVSTEGYYYDLQGKIRSNTRQSAHTLFTNTLLINHMSPEDFLNSLRSKVKNYQEIKDTNDYRQFEQTMMWSSNLYPFEQNKQLAELPGQDGEAISLRYAADYYSEYWGTYAAMHRLITRIYNGAKKPKDTYYNRYLYRVLREVAQFLLVSTDISLINRRNLVGTIFYNEVFLDDDEGRTFLAEPASRNSQPVLNQDSWKNRIYELSASELERIESAVEDLFWRLNKMGYLSIGRDSSWKTPINLKINLGRMSFRSVDQGFPDITKSSSKEKQLVAKYQLAYTRFRNLNGTSSLSAPNIGVATISWSNGAWIAKPAAKSQRFTQDITQELEILKTFDIEIKNHLLKTLHAWLQPYHPANIAVLDLTDNVLTVEDKSGKKLIVIENPDKLETESSIKAKTKVLAIHKFAKRYASETRSTYLKKYHLPNDFKGYQTILTSTKRDIKKYFKI